MLIREKITLVFWFVLSSYFCIESYRLGLGSIHVPGPGFLTFWVSIIIFIFVVILFLRGMRRKLIGKVEPLFRGKNLRNVVYGSILLFVYGLLFNKIGFLLSTLLFTGFCLKIIGRKKWPTVIGFSLMVTIVAYMVFVVWLQIQFPKGNWVGEFVRF